MNRPDILPALQRGPILDIVAYFLRRHRRNQKMHGFIKRAYAAAIGTILGASILLGKVAIGDWLTAAIDLVSLGILFRCKVSTLLLIGSAPSGRRRLRHGLVLYDALYAGCRGYNR